MLVMHFYSGIVDNSYVPHIVLDAVKEFVELNGVHKFLDLSLVWDAD